MDHQVEDDIDIGRAARPSGLAHGGDAAGIGETLGQLADGRREALDMPDLEDDAGTLGARDKIVGGGAVDRDRLFDEDVHAGIEEIAGNRVVEAGRNCDRHGIDLADQRAVVGEGLGAGLGGIALGTGTVGIGDGDQNGTGMPGIVAHMVPPESAGPDDANPDAFTARHAALATPAPMRAPTTLGRHVRRAQPAAPLKNCNALKYGATGPQSGKNAGKIPARAGFGARHHPIAN